MFSAFAPAVSRAAPALRCGQPLGAASRMSLNARGLHTTLRPLAMPRFGGTTAKAASPFFFKALGIAGVGIGISLYTKPAYQCEPTVKKPVAAPPPRDLPPPPASAVNVYELTFGTVCGICAGVFIKKGAKALAFVLGGVFVLLQYLGSLSLLHVNWNKMGGRFEHLFYTTDATGARKAPTIYSLWRWIINFLTADFQPRATFVAGLALGLRIG